MKKALVVLLIGAGAFCSSCTRKAEQSEQPEPAKEPAAAGKSAAAPAVRQPSPSPATPAKPKLSWPPTQAELHAVIPDYTALEVQIKAAGEGLGLKLDDEAFRKQMGSMWNAMDSGGGTARALLKWEMGQFEMAGTTRPFDPKNTLTTNAAFLHVSGGQTNYLKVRPTAGDAPAECWEKVTLNRGTERTVSGNAVLMTIGGTRTQWLKLAWDPARNAWVRRTEAERRKFLDDYEAKLRAKIEEARAIAAKPPDLKNVREVTGLAQAFRPAFQHRFLTRFIQDYRDTPWPEAGPAR